MLTMKVFWSQIKIYRVSIIYYMNFLLIKVKLLLRVFLDLYDLSLAKVFEMARDGSKLCSNKTLKYLAK